MTGQKTMDCPYCDEGTMTETVSKGLKAMRCTACGRKAYHARDVAAHLEKEPDAMPDTETGQKTQPTAGAMRAAKALKLGVGPLSYLANIIDRETGLPELLEVCRAAKNFIETGQIDPASPADESMDLLASEKDAIIAGLTDAIAKAT